MIKNVSKMSRLLSLAVVSAVVFLGSCKKDPGTEPVEKKCEQRGVFRKAMCTWSLFDSWSIVPDGRDEYLVPVLSTVGIPENITDGQEVYFSYEEAGFICGNEVNCDAIPDKPVRYVKITCISTTPPATDACVHPGVLMDMRGGKLDGCGWLVKLDNGEVLDVGMQIDEKICAHGDKVVVGYKVSENMGSICMAGIPAELTCINVLRTITD